MFFHTEDKYDDSYERRHKNINWNKYLYIILAIIILIIIILLVIYFYNSSNVPVVPSIKHRYIPLKE
jgi:uncharacterized integral membrane protein